MHNQDTKHNSITRRTNTKVWRNNKKHRTKTKVWKNNKKTNDRDPDLTQYGPHDLGGGGNYGGLRSDCNCNC